MLAGPEKIASIVEYTRSRMRICRDWAVNSAALAMAWNLLVWNQLAGRPDAATLAAAGTLTFLLLFLGSFYAWRVLAEAQYEKVKWKYDYLQMRAAQSLAGRDAAVTTVEDKSVEDKSVEDKSVEDKEASS